LESIRHLFRLTLHWSRCDTYAAIFVYVDRNPRARSDGLTLIIAKRRRDHFHFEIIFDAGKVIKGRAGTIDMQCAQRAIEGLLLKAWF
jgi:hypothetical protein